MGNWDFGVLNLNFKSRSLEFKQKGKKIWQKLSKFVAMGGANISMRSISIK
jgi:hypothetical protein